MDTSNTKTSLSCLKNP
jgi:hypothetical protein